MRLSSGLLFQKNSFLEWCCGSIPVNLSIINLVLEVHCDLYMHRIDNLSRTNGRSMKEQGNNRVILRNDVLYYLGE